MNKKSILKTIKEYNRIRSPEATASLVEIKWGEASIKFSGPFCASCGVMDYFEDFVLDAENENLKLIIENTQQIDDESYLVEFKEVKK